jgi:hypothetical protein
MKFELSIWDGFSNNKRIVEEDNYVAAVTRYASNFPPAYIWSIVPIKEKENVRY